MHGRLKVKTTEQQEAEKKAEKTKRVKHYQATMKAIFDRRESGQLDQELLGMTAGVLVGNPDISTLWNIRKEMLELQLKEGDDASKADCLKKEVELTQQCLMTNPKSYGAWHHRCWCLLRFPEPDWKREINICNKYLALDERNFHCWDYRRFVVKEALVKPEDELDYTMERINTNFSNYSSWHLRSKLLPLCFPSVDGGTGISEEKRREELDLIQNAAFTDPDDSSAWFYHTWLLGGDVSNAEKSEILAFEVHPDHGLLVVVSRAASYNKIQISVDGSILENLTWIPVKPSPAKLANIWKVESFPTNPSMSMISVQVEDIALSADLKKGHVFASSSPISVLKQCSTKDAKTREVLMQDLQNCQELLELEPDSKWTRLSMVLVMKSLDEKKYLSQILTNLENLQTVDDKRKCYYQDMRSKLVVKEKLNNSIPNGELKLSGLGLTSISWPFCLSFVISLDLSNNKIRSTSFLPYLQRCKEIICDNNEIREIKGLPKDTMLKKFSLKDNPISKDAVEKSFQAEFPGVTFVF